MTRVGDDYREVLRPKGGPRHIVKEMHAQNGDIWPEGLVLGGEASREVSVSNRELLIAPSSASPLAVALLSPVLECHEGWWA